MKLPPRIEKWVMGMQDVDFELIYKPGKDEEDDIHYQKQAEMLWKE